MSNKESHFKSVHLFISGCICLLFVLNILALSYVSTEIMRSQNELDHSIDRLDRNLTSLENKVDVLPFRISVALGQTSQELKNETLLTQK